MLMNERFLNSLLRRTVAVALLLTMSLAAAQSRTDARVLEQEGQRSIVQLWEALTPLKSVASQMTTGAHPDDERSAVLALLSRGQGIRVITITANRGEGGQNSIGLERYDALGVLRSGEMEAASRAFNVELYFLSEAFGDPIFDASFTKSAVETLELWGGTEALMEKLVRVIRESRPDVLFTNFQDVWGQHGHHRAVSRATEEAFRLAADPDAFPEHFEMGLRPWQPKKLYLPSGTGGGQNGVALPATLVLATGEFDPIFGASYDQLGQQSRAYHRSQDMGSWIQEGPRTSSFHLRDAVIDVPETEETMFDGLPVTMADLAATIDHEALRAKLLEADAQMQDALAAFPDHASVNASVTSALGTVRDARTLIADAGLDDEVAYDVDFRLGLKEAELQHAHRVSALLVPRLVASATELTRGASTEFTLTAFVGGPVALENVTLDLRAPDGWTVERVDGETADRLAYNETATATFVVTVADDAEYFSPYRRNMHPFRANGEINGIVSYEVDGQRVEIDLDPTQTVAVLPDLSLRANAANLAHNLLRPDRPIVVDVAITSHAQGETSSTVSIVSPDGWSTEPASLPVSFTRQGDVVAASFTLVPPADVASGSYDFAIAADGDAMSTEWVRVVDYDHIDRAYMVLPATINVQAFEVEFDEDLRIGYVDTGVDLVHVALRGMGVHVDLLSADDLTTGDLSRYDTIMVGVYGYRLRPDLLAANDRIHDWVRNGGNLVVQYHRGADAWDPNSVPPHFIQHGGSSILNRVTDPEAPVVFLFPEHPLLNVPNAITDADFDGWIKERGLHLFAEWDPAYTTLFSITDANWPDTPEETPFLGSLLTTELGAGRFTATNLVLHLQIEENVPGAYRFYANLITPPQAD
jgi:LmbE family N-acetylglucosaminyl deacetylase